MPHKHNAARRHHIPKMAHHVTNWPEYEVGLRCRGSLTLWITPEALAQWRGRWCMNAAEVATAPFPIR